MQYFDESGKPQTRKSKTGWYLNNGTLTPVPSIMGRRKEILDFLEPCVRADYPDVTRADLEEMWDNQRSKLPKVLEYLELLKAKYIDENDRWRIISYKRAIKALETVEVPIVSGKQAQKIRGIGAGIAKKIDEILRTGGLEIIDKEGGGIGEKKKITDLFEGIWGVGPAKANTWYGQGYRTLEEIEKYETLTEAQKKTLEFYDDLQKGVSRKSITFMKEFYEIYLYSIDPDAKFILAGSYRRGASMSGDIDILISSKDIGESILEEYVTNLQDSGEVFYILQKSKNKITTLVQFPGGKVAKADIFYIPWGSWGPGLVAWTGPRDFVVNMRNRARRKGCKLTDTKLTKGGKIIPTPTEKSVFEALGMAYVPPEKRY